MLKFDLLITNLRRIYAVLNPPLRRRVRVLFVLMMLQGIIELSSIFALTGFFTVLNAPQMFAASSHVQALASRFPFLLSLLEDPRRLVLWASVFPIALICLKNLFAFLVQRQSALLGEHVASYIGTGIMTRFLYMPYSWHLSSASGEALTQMQWRFNLGQMLIHILNASGNLITVALLFAGLIFYSPGVTLSSIGFMLLVSVTVYRLLRKRIDMASVQAAQYQGEETQTTMTAIQGIRELLIYQQQPVFLKAIARDIEKGMPPRTFLNISPAVPSWCLESAGFLLIWIAIFLLVAIQDASLTVITTTVALLTLTAWRVLPSLNRVVGSIVCIKGFEATALGCLDYFSRLEELPPEAQSPPAKEFAIRESISFDHVSYRYPGATEDALKDISISIPLGATIGVVGRSGAGKSTFINVLSGLLPPTSGEMLADGVPLRGSHLTAYRRRIGYVPQAPYLLAGSVAQNVAFSEWGQPIDEARVKKACREAAIDFLGEGCERIDTRVGNGGAGLSGGQAQRVSIARALFVDPALLIFDEATSALDQASESLIQEAVHKGQGKRTTIIAAHRLSTLEICDEIIWIEGGKVIIQGQPGKIIEYYKKELSSYE